MDPLPFEDIKTLTDDGVGTVTSKEAKLGVLVFIYHEMTDTLRRGVIVDIDRANKGYTVLDIEALKWEQKPEQYVLCFSDYMHL